VFGFEFDIEFTMVPLVVGQKESETSKRAFDHSNGKRRSMHGGGKE
jgi:hypothetical protein